MFHPSQQTGVGKQRAEKYLRGGQGGLVGFELKGGSEAGRKSIDALKLLYHVANIGDARSLAIHQATTTHPQLSPEEQLATGVSENYVRLSPISIRAESGSLTGRGAIGFLRSRQRTAHFRIRAPQAQTR